MGKTLLLFCLLALALSDPVELNDGITRKDKIASESGGTLLYRFRIGHDVGRDLLVSLTPYSDLSDPEVFMSDSQNLSQSSHKYPKEPSSRGFSVSQEEVTENTTYYILVVCEASCRYALTVAYGHPIVLDGGLALNGDLREGSDALYLVNVDPQTMEEVVISVTPTSLQMKVGVEVKAGNDTLSCSPAWHAGSVCVIDHPEFMEYQVQVTAATAVSYSILMTESRSSVELRAGVPAEGKVKEGAMKLFRFEFDRLGDTIVLTLTAMSGDPDLYVKVNSEPTRDGFDFNAIQQGADTLIITKGDRNEKNIAGGTYFVGVYGAKQSSFTLTVSYNTGTFVPLTPGIQQNGAVETKEINLYYMDVPVGQELNITMTVLPIAGKSTFFVKLCTSPLKRCRLTLKELSGDNPDLVASDSQDTVSIPHPRDSCKGTNCRYSVAVKSADSARASYRVYGSYEDSTPHLLRANRPSQMAMPAGGLRYFWYEVLNTTVISLTVQVTPVTGDPDLYATRNASLRDFNSFEKRSTKSLSTPDSVTFTRESDGPSLVGEYFFAVYAPFSYSFFTIIASEQVPSYNTTINLRAGHVQMDTLSSMPDGHFRIFSFATQYTEDTQKPIKLTLTPLSGAFDVFVDNSEKGLNKETMVFSYFWRLTDMKVANRMYDLVIDTTDKNYKPQAVYLVIVVARRFQEGSASYMLLYRSGHNPVRLQDDVAVRDDVDAKDLRLYSYTLFEEHEDVTIIVTALSGDPDLYVSYHASNTQPDKNNYDVGSFGFGGEVLTLQWETLQSACKQLPCTVYAAVVAYSACVYDIKAITRKDLPQSLPLDTPQRGQLNKTEYSYYYSIVSVDSDLQVRLQSIQGDADLFITVFEALRASYNVSDWDRPNRNEYLNSSQHAGAFDRIHLTSDVLKLRCQHSCIVLTGVYCSSESCQYVLYHEQDGMQLVEGVPAQGFAAAGKFAYFRFYCDRPDADIVITVTQLTEAIPRLYVSRGADARPNAENYNWTAVAKHGKPLVLRPKDLEAEGKSMRDHFAVGVTSSKTQSFTISVSFTKRPEVLVSGVPTSGTTSANATSHYSFFSTMQADISIRVTPITGFVELYAASHTIDEADVPMPTRASHTWTSTQSGNVHELLISSSDPRFCVQCNIYVSVIAVSRNSTYRITASNLKHMTQLTNGIPVQGSVRKDEIVRYTFDVLEANSFDIALVTLSGNADLFVGLFANVSSAEFVWSARTKQQVDHIRVSKADHRFAPGTFYIGVAGTKESSYSITAHVRSSFIHLVSGWPQFYSMQLNEDDNFFFDFKVVSGEKVSCVLRSITNGFRPQVFVTFETEDSTETKIPTPDPENAADANFQFNELRFSYESGVAGKYNIGVYPPETGSTKADVANFQLTCASVSEIFLLKQTDSAFSSLDEFVPVRRYMVSTEEVGTLSVTVSMCSGKVSLKLSKFYSETSSSLLPVISVGGELKATVTNSTGPFYLTVSLVETSAYFDGAGFEILTKFQTLDSPVHQGLQAGNDGEIMWDPVGIGRITLKWEPPVFLDGKTAETVKYRVLTTQSKEVTMNTVCGMRIGEMNSLVFEEPTPKPELPSRSLELAVGKTVSANVIAEVALPDGIEFVSYTSIHVTLPAGRGSSLSASVIGLIVATTAVLLTLLLVYMYRYRKAQRRLEYELSDVRNVASISSSISDPESTRQTRRNVVYSPLQLEASDA